MKKTYETPSVTVVPLKQECALLQSSDDTPTIGGGIALDSIEQPHNG